MLGCKLYCLPRQAKKLSTVWAADPQPKEGLSQQIDATMMLAGDCNCCCAVFGGAGGGGGGGSLLTSADDAGFD